MLKNHITEDQFNLSIAPTNSCEMSEKERLLLEALKWSSLREVCAGVSHEINNPLAIILGKSFQLRKALSKLEVQSEEIHKLMDDIDRTAVRISKTIQELRHFSN